MIRTSNIIQFWTFCTAGNWEYGGLFSVSELGGSHHPSRMAKVKVFTKRKMMKARGEHFMQQQRFMNRSPGKVTIICLPDIDFINTGRISYPKRRQRFCAFNIKKVM